MKQLPYRATPTSAAGADGGPPCAERSRLARLAGAAALGPAELEEIVACALAEAELEQVLWTPSLDRLMYRDHLVSHPELWAQVEARAQAFARWIEIQPIPRTWRAVLASFRYRVIIEATLRGPVDIDLVRGAVGLDPAHGELLACNPRLGQGEVDHLAWLAHDLFCRGGRTPGSRARREREHGRAILITLQQQGHVLPARVLSDLALRTDLGADGARAVLGAFVHLAGVPETTLRYLCRRHGGNRDFVREFAALPMMPGDLLRDLALQLPEPAIAEHPRMTPELLRAMAQRHDTEEFHAYLATREDARADPVLGPLLRESRYAAVLVALCRAAPEEEFPALLRRLIARSASAALDLLESSETPARPLDFLPLLQDQRWPVRNRALLALGHLQLSPSACDRAA